MQSFHAARSGRAATVRMVARSAERTRIRMGTQNSSTPPRTESFQLRTVDTGHESCPGIPEIYRQQLSTIHLSLEPHRHTLHTLLGCKLIHILMIKCTCTFGAYVKIIVAYLWLSLKLWTCFLNTVYFIARRTGL